MSEIDVSKCEYLEYELEEDGNYYYFCKIAPRGTDEQCHNFNDCYYKQVQQLKQENEELKENLAINKDAFNSICVEKYKLEQCLDEINEICKLSLHCDSCYEILQKIKQAKEN